MPGFLSRWVARVPGRARRYGGRRRLLDPLAQAVLVIAFLRTNLTYAELAAGFGISESTCWRDVAEGVSALADRGWRISLADVAKLAVKMGWDYVVVDGAGFPIVAAPSRRAGPSARNLPGPGRSSPSKTQTG